MFVMFIGRSGHLRRPAPLTGHVIGPALAAAGQVFSMGDQTLVQLAGEHRNAVHPGVAPEPVAGHAGLAAADGDQNLLVEVGPNIDWDLAGSRIAARGGGFDAGRDYGLFIAEYACTSKGREVCRVWRPSARAQFFSAGKGRIF